jgi:D-glycero-D-manno-heptose 1,7-bisphosphate phosphatase
MYLSTGLGVSLSNSNQFHETKQAVFLDRDGTLNVEKEYLYQPEEFEFTPGAIEAVRLLNRAGYLVVVVTNQSGVARGYYGEEEVVRLHHYIDTLLQAGGACVDAWYYCPHHPGGKPPYNLECGCRKPLPGMLQQAAADLCLDLSRSWMVGDKITDIEAGLAAGCKPVLVLTGYGTEAQVTLPPDLDCCFDLLAAAHLITAV